MIIFKKATKEDVEELTKVMIRAFDEDVKKYGEGPPGFDSTQQQLIYIEETTYYKILDNHRIVGGIILIDKGSGHFSLHGLYIDANAQGQGVGSKAIKFIEENFPEVTKWTLETPYLSTKNHHFYEKMGYCKTGEICLGKPKEFKLFSYEKVMR